jgi:hypothetical protein
MTTQTKPLPSKAAADRMIIALDGEGKNIPLTDGIDSANPLARQDGWHSYSLLVAADQDRKAKWIQTDYSRRESTDDETARNYALSTRACLDFILSLPEEALLVGFYFSYDVVKILADVPVTVIRELVDDSKEAKRTDRAGKATWGNYALEYRPRKYFKVALLCDRCAELTAGETPSWRCDCYKWRKRERNGKVKWERQGLKHQRIVWDIFGFFQKSFVKALQDSPQLFDPDVVKRIADMKLQRENFDHLPDDQIREYCIDECQYLSLLFRDMLIHIENMGLKLGRFDGAGALASAFYRQKKTKEHISDAELPEDVALHAYFGGRFEISEIGFIGDAYAYDINSAYPYIISTLPCLACGRFRPVSEYVPGAMGVYRVGSRTSGKFAPFPFRTNDELAKAMNAKLREDGTRVNLTDKAIFYAHGGQRWVWQDEVAAARKHFGDAAIPVYEGYVFEPGCDHKPFADIPALYRKRRELKKAGDGAEKVYKLMLNSLYGKLAQSIGWKLDKNGLPQPPEFQSFAWAGMITSGTRAMILDAVMQGDVVSIATDGILSRTEIPALLPSSKELGMWERDRVRDLYLFQSGVYCGETYDEESGKASPFFKTRGFSATEIPADKLKKAWHAGQLRIKADVGSSRFIPMKLGVKMNNATEFIGQWVHSVHDVQLVHTRRMPAVEFDDFGLPITDEKNSKSEPFHVPHDWMSAPYTPKETWEDVLGETEGAAGDFLEATADDAAELIRNLHAYDDRERAS